MWRKQQKKITTQAEVNTSYLHHQFHNKVVYYPTCILHEKIANSLMTHNYPYIRKQLDLW